MQYGSYVWEVVKTIKRLSGKLELCLEGWLGVTALEGLWGAGPQPSGTCCSEEAAAVCLGPCRN